jgi:hypothetical protein
MIDTEPKPMIVISTRTAMTEFVVSLNVQSKASDARKFMFVIFRSYRWSRLTIQVQTIKLLCTVAP